MTPKAPSEICRRDVPSNFKITTAPGVTGVVWCIDSTGTIPSKLHAVRVPEVAQVVRAAGVNDAKSALQGGSHYEGLAANP